MEKWFVPDHMKTLAGSSTRIFGYDQTDSVEYSFNSLGFRSQEPSRGARLAVIGNSVSFGIGLPFEQSFGSIISKKLNLELDNLSLGCYPHENYDTIINIQSLAQQNQETIFIIQINNLDRVRYENKVIRCDDSALCMKKFLDYFDQVTQILHNRPCMFVYWDDKSYDIPNAVSKKIKIKNQFHLDQSLSTNSDTFGSTSHKVIAQALLQIILTDKVQPV